MKSQHTIIVLCILSMGLLNNCIESSDNKWKGECLFPHDIGTIEIIPALDRNELRVIFTVETAEYLDSYIRYWEFIESDSIPPDSLMLYSPLSENKKAHELMIVNLKPSTHYNFSVVIQNESCKTYSKVYKFTTKQRPPWIPYYKENDSLKNVKFDKYVHFHSKNKPGYLLVVNDIGQLVWYKSTPFTIKVSRFTKESTFLTIMADDTLKYSRGNKIAEVDLFGQLIYRYDADEKGTDKVFHHEIDLDDRGNIVTLTYDKRVFDLSEIGGTRTDTISGDGILVMNKQDNIVWEWSVFDVMHPREYDNTLNEKDDWLHANALVKDLDGNFIISFRNASEIWKISSETGELIWKLGGKGDEFNLPENLIFHGQHNIQIDEKGFLHILDNGNLLVKPGMLGKLKDKRALYDFRKTNEEKFVSRHLIFDIDDATKSAVLIKEIKYPKQYMTKSQGSSTMISDSLFMFCSTNTGRILFTDQEGRIKGHVGLAGDSYRAEYIRELYPTDYVK